MTSAESIRYGAACAQAPAGAAAERSMDGGTTTLGPLPPLLTGTAFAALFLWVVAALGRRTLRLLRVELGPLDAWERGLVCAAFGAGGLQYLPFGLALAGSMTRLALRVSCAVLLVLLAPEMLRVARSARAALAGLRVREVDRATLLWIAVLAVYLGLLLVRAVSIGNMGDDDGYHLAAPRRWLALGRLAYLPTLTHTNGTLGMEMLYAIGLSTGGPVAAKMMHFTLGLLCLAGLALCGLRLGNRLAALGAVTLALVPSPLNELPYLISLAYNDLAVCAMMLAALTLWLGWRREPQPGLLAAGALCAGFAGSFKFTALSVGLAFVLVSALELRQRGLRGPQIAAWAAGLGTLCLVPSLPWLYRNWHLTGNPVYPMFPRWIPTRDWSDEHGRIFEKFFRYYNWAKRYGDRLALLRRQEILLAAGLWLLLLLGFLIVTTRRAELRQLLVFGATMLAGALWLAGLYFRFWLPALLCFALVGAALFADRFRDRAWPVWAAALLLVAGLGLRLRGEAVPAAGWKGDLLIATGRETLDEAYREDPLWNMWADINSVTRGDARVLVAAFYTTFGASSAGAFWMNRDAYATDSQLQTFIELESWPAFLDSVARAGIDYVLISDEQFAAGRHGFTFTAGLNEYPFCRRLVAERGELVRQRGHLQLYRLRGL